MTKKEKLVRGRKEKYPVAFLFRGKEDHNKMIREIIKVAKRMEKIPLYKRRWHFSEGASKAGIMRTSIEDLYNKITK